MIVEKLNEITHSIYFTNLDGVLSASEMVTIQNMHPGFMNSYLKQKKTFEICNMYFVENQNKAVKLFFIPVVQKHGELYQKKILDSVLCSIDEKLGIEQNVFAVIPNILATSKNIKLLQDSQISYQFRTNLSI